MTSCSRGGASGDPSHVGHLHRRRLVRARPGRAASPTGRQRRLLVRCHRGLRPHLSPSALHATRSPQVPARAADALVVVLHGHDDDPDRLPAASWPTSLSTRIGLMVPVGPASPPRWSGWFRDRRAGMRPRPPAPLDALVRFDRAVRRTARSTIGRPRSSGYSQGGAAALGRGLPVEQRSATGRSSGWRPGSRRARHRVGLRRRRPTRGRALLVHGNDDEVVLHPGARATRVLERHGAGQVPLDRARTSAPLLPTGWAPRCRPADLLNWCEARPTGPEPAERGAVGDNGTMLP